MRLLEVFYEKARNAFEKSGLGGVFQGIKVKEGSVYLIYSGSPTSPPEEIRWEQAAGTWESVYRELKNIGR